VPPPPCFLSSYCCAPSDCLHAVCLPARSPLSSVIQGAEMLTSCIVGWSEGPCKTTQKLAVGFRAGIQTGTSRLRSSRVNHSHAKLRWIDWILDSEVYPVLFLFAAWPQACSQFATKRDVIRLCELDCLFSAVKSRRQRVFVSAPSQSERLSRTVMDSALCFWKHFFFFNSILCCVIQLRCSM
jgi:hypothetical protein